MPGARKKGATVLLHADGALSPMADILKRAVPIALYAIYGRIGYSIMLHPLPLAQTHCQPAGNIRVFCCYIGSGTVVEGQGSMVRRDNTSALKTPPIVSVHGRAASCLQASGSRHHISNRTE